MLQHLDLTRKLVGKLCVAAFFALLTYSASAQFTPVFTLPDTPCDTTLCSQITYTNKTAFPQAIIGAHLRDSVNYAIAPLPLYPITVQPGDSASLPICFSPGKRGVIIDSLSVYILAGAIIDTQRVRLIGRGIGPEVTSNPTTLNFPRTAVFATSVMQVTLINSGELPYPLSAAVLAMAPPFLVQPPIPPNIPAGDSVVINVAFTPTTNGIFTSTINLTTVCGGRAQIVANGATDLIGTGAVIRVSKTAFNPQNNEQSPCDASLCTDVTVQNVGNAPLIIDSIKWADPNNEYVITPAVTLPIVIAPNGQSIFRVCLSTKSRGLRQDSLIFVSNTRNSIAFGMVIDRSGSMADAMQCGSTTTTKMAQAILQAQSFIDKTLLYIPTVGVQDEIAISSYANNTSGQAVINTVFPLTLVTPTSRTAARNSVSGIVPTGGTPTGAAVTRMIDTLSKSPLQQRVIVLLTDGDASGRDSIDFSINGVIAPRAIANNIRIFTIGIAMTNTGRAYLKNMADKTKGLTFDASDCGSLQAAFEAITDALSRGTHTMDPYAIRITSTQLITNGIVFDSVYIGDSVCKSVTLTNTGDGDAIVDAMTIRDLLGNLSMDFVIPPTVSLPITVPEGGQVVIPICFTPTTLRTRSGTATVVYNNCDSIPLAPTLTGAAYANANLRINDQRIGLPGSSVSMPIYCDTTMNLFGVDTIMYQVRWNKTMLELAGVTPMGATQLVGTPSITFDTQYEIATITVSGKNIAGNGQLANLDFTVLRGDTLATLVEVIAGKFQDGNPRAILVNSGIIAYDSTCFRSSKGISTIAGGKIVVGTVTPNPSTSGSVVIPVTAENPSNVSIEVFAPNGDKVLGAYQAAVVAGENQVTVSLSDLPAGIYYVSLRSGSGDVQLRKVVLAK